MEPMLENFREACVTREECVCSKCKCCTSCNNKCNCNFANIGADVSIARQLLPTIHQNTWKSKNLVLCFKISFA